MRTDPGKRMRRPENLELPEFWEKLEAELRDRIVRDPPRRFGRRRISAVRMLRSVARPALHGGMAVIMAAVLILSGRPSPATFGYSGIEIGPQHRDVWASVVEILDPQPVYVPVRVVRPRPRFVSLIQSTAQVIEPTPELNLLVRV